MHIINRRTALKASSALGVLSLMSCSGGDNNAQSSLDLAEMDAVATALAIKNGDLTAGDVVNAAIERAEAVNGKINAIVSPYYDSARSQAANAADAAWFGVPTFVKDLDNVIGQRTTFGSRAFQNNVATVQSPFIDAYFATGLISLGKSTTPEFGLTATTEPLLGGPTHNPWNLDYSSGGSSGGAAALVAARVVPVAHASDGGGSIRLPASCCGVVGLKPTRGRTPRTTGPESRPVDISQHGIEARTVRDIAAFFSMMEVDSDLPKIGLVEGPASQRRNIAFFTQSPVGGQIDPEVVAATEEAARKLEDNGHVVTEINAPFDAGVLQDFTVYWGAGAAQAVADWEQIAGRKASYDDFEPWTYGVIDYFESRRHTLEDVIGRLVTFESIYARALRDFDMLLSPTMAAPPPPIGYIAPGHGFPLLLERLSELICFTQYMNISGAPAMSLPTAMSSSGLPIGIQIAAKTGDERVILEAAYELESELPWRDRRPDI